MATPKQRLLALLATGRVANLPTVWTNVLVGALLSSSLVGTSVLGLTFSPGLFALSALLASCLYLGGCFLGDASDAKWDAEHRADRPIPSGVLSSTRVAIAGYSLLAAGWFGGCVFDSMMWAVEAPEVAWSEVQSITPSNFSALLDGLSYERAVLSTLLALSILLYAKLHKRLGAGAPFLMALCRGLLVFWAGSLSGYGFLGLLMYDLLPYATCLMTYILVLSMVARNESKPDAKLPAPLLQVLYLAPPVAGAIFFAARSEWTRSLPGLGIAAAAFLFWSIRSLVKVGQSIPAFVSRALAGICLLDALFAALFGWQTAAACFVLFLFALLLQRLAPAT